MFTHWRHKIVGLTLRNTNKSYERTLQKVNWHMIDLKIFGELSSSPLMFVSGTRLLTLSVMSCSASSLISRLPWNWASNANTIWNDAWRSPVNGVDVGRRQRRLLRRRSPMPRRPSCPTTIVVSINIIKRNQAAMPVIRNLLGESLWLTSRSSIYSLVHWFTLLIQKDGVVVAILDSQSGNVGSIPGHRLANQAFHLLGKINR